jgi:hypothetical protein
VGGTGAVALAGLAAGRLPVLDLGSRISGGQGAIQQAEHGGGAEQPHRGGPGGQAADQGGRCDRDLEQGRQGDRGDQQQPRQPQHGPMPTDLVGQASGMQGHQLAAIALEDSAAGHLGHPCACSMGWQMG